MEALRIAILQTTAGSKTDGKMCGGCTSEQRWPLDHLWAPHPVQLLHAVLGAEVVAS